MVNKELKYIKTDFILLSRIFWKFSRKEECNSIIHRQQITFQASDYKGRNFLDLNDDKKVYICSTYTKRGAQLKNFGLSNSICVQITRSITNHAPIDEYRLRFFLQESIACPYRNYLIKTKRHILFKCPRYSKYQNSRRKSLIDILMFLEFNPKTFHI